MSLDYVSVLVLRCDHIGCVTVWAGDVGADDAAVRQEAEDGGDWRRVGNRDLCGEHRPEE